MDPLLHTGALRREIQHWRLEAQDRKSNLMVAELSAERELQRLRGEVDTCQRQMHSAEERASWSENQVASLSVEGRETAALCQELAAKVASQAQQDVLSQTQLRQSEMENEHLKRMLREYQSTECDRAERLAAAQTRFLHAVPQLREELQAEVQAARQASQEEAHAKLAASEQCLYTQIRKLGNMIEHERRNSAELGRRCQVGQERIHAEEAKALSWQNRALAAEQELTRLGRDSHHIWELSQRHKEELIRQEAMSHELKEQRDRAIQLRQLAEEHSRQIRGWMLSSIDSSKRGVSSLSDEIRYDGEDSNDRGWVAMLDKFRERQQTRNGFGVRTSPPATMRVRPRT